LAAFILFTPLSAAPAPPLIWHPADSGLPANVETLAAAPITLYAGTWGEGVYRSTDHGATWQPANTGIALPLHVQGGLAVNPVTPTQLFAGDYYGGGLYRSNNGAISWTLVLSDTAVRAVAVHPLSPTIVLAGDREEGLYRSVDGGNAWALVDAAAGLTDPHVRALAFAPAAPDTVYAGAGPSVFVSANAGVTWSLASTLSSTVQALDVHPVTPTILYAGTFADGLFRSTDGGASWTPMKGSIPAYAWVTSLAIHPLTPTIVYAGTWDGEVHRTLDGGTTWKALGYLGAVYDVIIHPTAPSVIYAATSNNGVFRGSTLDHLTIAPIPDPQYVSHTFPITLTARDALGFPLTGESQLAFSLEESSQQAAGFFTGATQAQLRTLQVQDSRLAATLASGGYAGAATLADATDTLTPTTVNLVDGIATANVTVSVSHPADIITATIPGGPSVTSNPFDVVYAPLDHVAFAPIADQVIGRPFTITLTARDALSLTVLYTGTAILGDTTGTLALVDPGPCSGTLALRCAGPFVEGV
jgi:photosystem II stability/assembly factor-like uncharacterized protein